ncbi:unnamed protein product [Tenebrio molitor]|nr:unnamed protein product [Tenebrio molitor]
MVLKNFTLYLDPALIGLKDSTTDDYPLMNSPLEPTAIVALYSLFLFNLGPKFMKNRDAFSLKKVMMVYNFVQVVLNFVVFLMVVKLLPNFNLCCNPVNTSNSPEDIAIRRAHYCYTLLKFLDLFDTIFFVLRKKHQQITLLHVHHHIGMAMTTWATAKYLPGGVAFFVFIWNTFIHVLMYGYYLFTSISSMRAVQHCFVSSVFMIHLFNTSCNYSKGWLIYYLLNAVMSIYLFLMFYKKNYIDKKQVSDKKVY